MRLPIVKRTPLLQTDTVWGDSPALKDPFVDRHNNMRFIVQRVADSIISVERGRYLILSRRWVVEPETKQATLDSLWTVLADRPVKYAFTPDTVEIIVESDTLLPSAMDSILYDAGDSTVVYYTENDSMVVLMIDGVITDSLDIAERNRSYATAKTDANRFTWLAALILAIASKVLADILLATPWSIKFFRWLKEEKPTEPKV